MEIGIINNLNAKKVKKKGITSSIFNKILQELGEARDTLNLSEMERVLDYFKEKGVKFLGISGGDGTVQQVITAWIRKFGEKSIPHIVMLGGGSTNTIMNGIGQKVRSPIDTLKTFVSDFKSKDIKIIKQRILKVETNLNTYYGASFANGILYKMEKKYFDDGKPGVFGVFIETIQIILGIIFRIKKFVNFITPIKCEIKIDGKFLSNTMMTVGASVLNKPFPVVDPFKNLRGELYYLFSNLNFFETVINLINIAFGKKDIITFENNRKYHRGTASRIELKQCGGFTIDGELFSPNNSEVIISPGPQLSFVVA